jgi:hypothetical protein
MTARTDEASQRTSQSTQGLSMAALLWLGLALLGWAELAGLAFDMGHPLAQLAMPMSPQWSAANLLASFAMWAVMMAAMMLPLALPMVQPFVRCAGAMGSARARASLSTPVCWCGCSSASRQPRRSGCFRPQAG